MWSWGSSREGNANKAEKEEKWLQWSAWPHPDRLYELLHLIKALKTLEITLQLSLLHCLSLGTPRTKNVRSLVIVPQVPESLFTSFFQSIFCLSCSLIFESMVNG